MTEASSSPLIRIFVVALLAMPPMAAFGQSDGANPVDSTAPASASSASAPAPTSAVGGEATLNLEQLETRVRDTPAIGFFTKLQLKGEIDDLLEEMERFHQSDSELVLDDLQSRYELLFLKLLTLLQDDDPDLHQDVAAARGEIWAILADPERFQEARHGSVS